MSDIPKDIVSKGLTFEDVDALLTYDKQTGKLFWKPRGPEAFASVGSYRSWNSKNAGREALTSTSACGYRQGFVLWRHFYAHRIAWLLATGEWPPDKLDHINGIGSDNRLCNLRCVSHAENMKNMKKPSNNKSGVVGVSWNKHNGKWLASIRVDGTQKYLGYSVELNEAVAMRKNAEIEYGFHKNHGRSVNASRERT